MKRALMFFTSVSLLALMSVVCCGYTNIVTSCGSSTEVLPVDDTAKSKVTIVATGCNVLYRGIKNPISITVCDDSEVVPSITDGAKIYRGQVLGCEGEYIVEITSPDLKNVLITAGGRSVKFVVMDLPTATIKIGGYRSGAHIPRDVIMKSERLDAEIEGFFPYSDIKYVVSQFSFLLEKDGITTSYPVEGGEIPKEMKSYIKDLPSGTLVAIIGIKVSTPVGLQYAPAMTFTLAE